MLPRVNPLGYAVSMPTVLIFRAMQADPGDRPIVGTEKFQLGARVPVDVQPVEGIVPRRKGGISVAPDDPRRLATIVRPSAWGGLAEENLAIFEMEVAALNTEVLHFSRDGAKHGSVQAERAMPLPDYQRALADTRPRWTRREP